MEAFQPVFDALATGADGLLDALVILALGGVAYLVAVARSAMSRGVPVWLKPVVAGLAEQYLQPIAENAVRQAEEWAQRQIDKGLVQAQTMGAAKLAKAKEYILKATPDIVIPDDKLGALIDAALVKVGLGAAGAIQVGVEVLETKIEQVKLPDPPAA